MTTYPLVIRAGNLVTSTGIQRADIAIEHEKIIAIAPELSGLEEISAAGMLVLPGGVDPHIHLEMPTPHTTTSDTWATGTRAAAFGGTTTVIDFVEPAYEHQALLKAFSARRQQAEAGSVIDFGFHMTLCSADEDTLRQIPAVMQAGMTSFKLYTTYAGFQLDDENLLSAFEAIAQAGGCALVHAESDAIIQHASRRLQQAGRLGIGQFAASRPAAAEKEAITRVLTLAAYTQAPIYIVHISTRAGAEAIHRARQAGQPAWGETCPQYLLLDEERLQTLDFSGAKFTCCPPLRTRDDQQALWDALRFGALQSIGSDHCAFNFSGQKELGRQSFLEIPSGLPGIELRMALLYHHGVKTGRISLEQWVDACCTAPARLFGLYPRKGTLAVGSDADVVIFDPHADQMVTHANLHENVDYTPYEGLPVSGQVRDCLLRGKTLIRNGQWIADSACGTYLPCSSYPRG